MDFLNYQVSEELRRMKKNQRRTPWLALINRKNLTNAQLSEKNSTLRVCGKHFISGRPSQLFESTNPEGAPTLHLGHDVKSPEYIRYLRAKRRREQKSETEQQAEEEEKIMSLSEEEHVTNQCSPHKSEIERLKMIIEDKNIQIHNLSKENQELKDKLLLGKIDVMFFKNKDENVIYYTGLSSFQILMKLYVFVEGDINNIISLTKFEEFILCSMRLRLGTSLLDIANRFQESKSTAGRIFSDTLDVMFIRLKKIVYWPERDDLQATMPMCFQNKYRKSITAIIDCFELFIERPSSLTARALTWSTYNHKNTIKFLIAITPQGSISSTSFISKGWGGRTTDKHITENSGFLRKLCHGDTIMTDRGFNIGDMIGSFGANLVIPSFTKGKSQLTAVEVEQTREIAYMRIHVERVIGLLRQKFTILNSNIPIDFLKQSEGDELTTLDKMVHTCCSLINLCTPIIPMD